jgi:hypothetical protein
MAAFVDAFVAAYILNRSTGSIGTSARHLTDMPIALANVCVEGKNGQDADVSVCPLLTLSRRL